MSERAEKTRQWLLAAGVGLVVLVLVVVALVRDPIQLDSSTPEGAVQAYLQAISDENYERAYEMLDPARFDECVPGDIARYAPGDPFTASLDDQGGEPTRDGEIRVVTVRMSFGTDGMFGPGWETWESFELISQDGFWWITGDPWPHFGWECPEEGDA